MMIIADFHFHSKYSRATSKDMDIVHLARGAKLKGLQLLGTGDFTHPDWLNELKNKLKPAEDLFVYNDVYFMLTGEIATIFTHEHKTKKVHHVLHAPNFEVVEQINEVLSKWGRLQSDGRPMLTVSAAEMVEAVMGVDKNIFIYPAHCLLPNEIIITNPDVKEIQNAKEGDRIFTHIGELQKIEKVLIRDYKGNIKKIVPWYFSAGIKITPEHPFLAIKTIKNCNGGRGVCKPSKEHTRNCYRHCYKKYKPTWIEAKDLEIGDVLLYPRITQIKDVGELEVKIFIKNVGNLPNKIKLNLDFCKLVGYYLAEGYVNGRDGIGFSFNKKTEIKYVREVKKLVKKIFGINAKKGKTKGDLIFYSKNLMYLFESLFYKNHDKNASNKCLPSWMLFLSKKKQVEIFKCWWRGDVGSTSSRLLYNQMKIICLRLGIIPCTRIDKKESHKKRGKHSIGNRNIEAKNDNYLLEHLAFFEDEFNLLKEKEFSVFTPKTDRRHAWMDKEYAYIPIRKMAIFPYNGKVFNLEVSKDNSFLTESAAIHNCWTPWFGVLGSKSGFDSMEECYQDQIKNIHGLETGLSSDPPMNWRLSALDKFTLLSNSDSHSPHPWRLGREANVFDLKKVSYKEIHDAIKEKDKKRFLFTVEVDPNYGKYHFDGHRNCSINLNPTDAKKHNNICPRCDRSLTIGVLHRVDDLADRPDGYVPKDAIPFKSLLPLYEIISFVTGTNQLYSQKVIVEQDKLIDKFGSEFNVLLDVTKEELMKVTNEKIADAIIAVREGKVKYVAGYDGVYGRPVFSEEEFEKIEKQQKAKASEQRSLKDFK